MSETKTPDVRPTKVPTNDRLRQLEYDVSSQPYSVIVELIDGIRELEQENARLKSQLPEGMEHCTILFKECGKGHGRLTATNWVQHDCPTCALAAEREKSALWERRAREMLAAGETLSEGIDMADKTIADLRKCDQAVKRQSGIGFHPDDVV